MGWLFTTRSKGTTNREFFEKEFRGIVIDDIAQVGFNTIYVASHHPNTPDKVYGGVILVRWDPQSDYNFGYKDMEEGMGPNESQCPERILKLLSPVDQLYAEGSSREWATQWRERCWRNVAERKDRVRLTKGGKYRMTKDVRFRIHTLLKGDVVECVNARRRIFRHDYVRYTIPDYHTCLEKVTESGGTDTGRNPA